MPASPESGSARNGAPSACPYVGRAVASRPAGSSFMSLNRFTTKDRRTRHAGFASASTDLPATFSAPAAAEIALPRVITITPTSAANTSSRTEPHTAVHACRRPPTATPSTPPAAPTSSTGSLTPGRPRARCSKPDADTTSNRPPSRSRAIESGSGLDATAARGSAPWLLSPSLSGRDRAFASIRRARWKATAPNATSPTGRAARTRPIPMASTQSIPSPTGPAADTQTLPATSSPATMAARLQMYGAWGRTTEAPKGESRREPRVAGLDPSGARSAGLAPLVAMKVTLPVTPNSLVNPCAARVGAIRDDSTKRQAGHERP